MAKIEVTDAHHLAMKKIFGDTAYIVLNAGDMSEYPEYHNDTVIQVRVMDGRDYMLDLWLQQYPDNDQYAEKNGAFYVYHSLAVDYGSMGEDERQRWDDSFNIGISVDTIG